MGSSHTKISESMDGSGNVEKILEQFMIERLLGAVSPEFRAWLKEQKPKTAEELENLANLHVQSGKSPLVEGRYASFGKNKGGSIQKGASYEGTSFRRTSKARHYS